MRSGVAAAATVAALVLPATPRSAPPERQAFLVLVEPMSFEDALRDPVMAGLGRSGGLGLLASPEDERTGRRSATEVLGAGGATAEALGEALREKDLTAVYVEPEPDAPGRAAAGSAGGVALLGGPHEAGRADLVIVPCCREGHARFVREIVSGSQAAEVAVIALPIAPTRAMLDRRDDVVPVAFARGAPYDLFPGCSTVVQAGGGTIEALPGCLPGLTSDTTRRAGLVSTNDVWPTLLDFLGADLPGGAAGSPIRVEDGAPIALHERYLSYRRIHTPAGAAVLAAVLLGLVGGLILLFGARRSSPRVVRGVATVGLASIAGAVSLLAASALPRFEPWLVLTVGTGGAAALTTVAVRARPADPVAPVAVVAAVGMLLVIADGMLGWRALLMPLIGGSSLEGVRFYGLGNGFGGLFAAGAVLTATRLRSWAGTALLAAAGMLAGLPGFGANLGVAVTLFAAAGLWHVQGSSGRVALRLAGGAAIAVGLLAGLLIAHRLADLPTHITRAVEEGNPLSVALERLALNVRNTSAHPAGWLAVAMLPLVLVAAWRRWGPFGEPLRRDPAWRNGIVTLALASIVGFLANDTIGVAGMGFAFCSAALLYPALAVRSEVAA